MEKGIAGHVNARTQGGDGITRKSEERVGGVGRAKANSQKQD